MSIICQDTSMISMLPEKLDCFPIFPSSSRDRVSEMPSSNSIWQLRRLNCFSDAGSAVVRAVGHGSLWTTTTAMWSPGGLSVSAAVRTSPSGICLVTARLRCTQTPRMPSCSRTSPTIPLRLRLLLLLLLLLLHPPPTPPPPSSISPPSTAPKCQGASVVGVTGVTGVVAWTVSLCLVHMAPEPAVGWEGSDRSREPFRFSSRAGALVVQRQAEGLWRLVRLGVDWGAAGAMLGFPPGPGWGRTRTGGLLHFLWAPNLRCCPRCLVRGTVSRRSWGCLGRETGSRHRWRCPFPGCQACTAWGRLQSVWAPGWGRGWDC